MQSVNKRSYGAALSLSAIIILAAAVRVFYLDTLEPFVDESFHLRFSSQGHFLIDLIHGFKVLGYLIFYPTTIFADNALLSTRLLVSIFGVGTVIGVFMVTKELSNWKSAAIAGAIWAVLPYATLHDRLALHDPFISFFQAWSFFFTAFGLKRQRMKMVCLGGLFMGLASITKITALTGLALIFFMSLAIPNRKKDYLKSGMIFFVGMAIPFVFLIPQFIDTFDGFRLYLENFTGVPKDASNVANMEVSGFGIERFQHNLSLVIEWISVYNGYAFCALASLSIIVAFLKPSKLATGLAISFLVSILSFVLIFKTWYPRYIIPSLIPLVMLIGIIVGEFTRNLSPLELKTKPSRIKFIIAIAVGLLFLMTLFSTATRAFKVAYYPQQADIPRLDRWQYLTGSISARGFNDVKSFMDKLGATGVDNIFVANIDSYYGDSTYALGLQILPMTLRNHKNLLFKSSSVFNMNLMEAVLNDLYQNPAKEKYIVGFKSALNKFFAYFTLTPSPKLVFENERYFVYQIPKIDSWKIEKKSRSVIANIDNRNGVDYPNNKALVWLGDGIATISFLSPSAGLARFSFRIEPSPRVQGKLGLGLKLSVGEKYKERIFTADHGSYNLTIPVEKGLNKLVLKTSEKINVTDVNMKDKRPLVLGVTDIKIVNVAETINGANFARIMARRIAKNKSSAIVFSHEGWPIAGALRNSKKVSVVSLLLQPRDAAIKILETFYANRDKKVFILSKSSGSSDFIESVMANLTPPPQIVWTSVGTTLYTPADGSWLKNESTGTIITDINNFNGVEIWKGTKSFWIGNKDTEITFLARKSGKALIEMDISLGPNAQQTSREIIIGSGDGIQNVIKIKSQKKISAFVKMKRGTNLVKISSKDKSSAGDAKLKNDKRILIFGVSALKTNMVRND